MTWQGAAPTAVAAFLASAVECVEAATIVLAVGFARGWRPPLAGAAAGLAAIAAIVAIFGTALAHAPIHLLQFAVGVLLLLFGMRWLRKAILRALGVVPLRDEGAALDKQTATLQGVPLAAGRLDPAAALTAFKAVLIEGIEVAFIVLAVAAGGPDLLPPAIAGALAACLIVTLAAALLHRPLARVPENQLKFVVGVILSAFGIFWVGEGLDLPWPGGDWSIPALAVLLLLAALAAIRLTPARREADR